MTKIESAEQIGQLLRQIEHEEERARRLGNDLSKLRERCGELARDLRDSQINVDTLADELANMAKGD